jgi:hypothetical protein
VIAGVIVHIGGYLVSKLLARGAIFTAISRVVKYQYVDMTIGPVSWIQRCSAFVRQFIQNSVM